MNKQRVNKISVERKDYGEVWAISLDLNIDPDSDDEAHRICWGQWIPVDSNPVQVANYLRHIADSIMYTSSVHGVFGLSPVDMPTLAKGGACTFAFRSGQHSYKSAEDICWCGCCHRNQSEKPYRCVPFSFVDTYPELASAFAANGYTQRSPFEIGVVLASDWDRITTTGYGKRSLVRENTRWRHANGSVYTVLMVTNCGAGDDKRKEYPITVVYQGEDGKIWSKQIDSFLKNRMLLV